jgi:hypothetical protein
MTYSLDFRQKVLKIKEQEELTQAEAAVRFGVGVGVSSIMRWGKCLEPSGESLFCERFLGVLPKNQQKLRDRYAFGCPSRPGHSFATQQGVAHMLSNDSTRCRIACIFTTLSLHENTCTIASGDYSTPVSQRMK